MKRCFVLLFFIFLMSTSMVAVAETKAFDFVVYMDGGGSNSSYARKADSEQNAYITLVSARGRGTAYAASYTNGEQRSIDVPWSVNNIGRAKSPYYIYSGPKRVYYLFAQDSEYNLRTNLQVYGRWTP